MKLEIIIDILFDLLSKKSVTALYLSQKYGVSTRSIYRYIACLENAGVPIYTTRGKYGGFSIIDTYRLSATFMTVAADLFGIVEPEIYYTDPTEGQQEVDWDYILDAIQNDNAMAIVHETAGTANFIPAQHYMVIADYVEIDVQETKDGVVVVYHDASLRRITGDAGRIWEYTYGELLLMDFGGWFSEEYAGTQIPTLEQVLELCRGRIAINIELKADRVSETLVEKTLELVELYGMEGQVVISSTDYGYLRQVKELKPDIPTGYILFAAYGRHFDDENIDFLSVRSDFITNTLVKSAHEAGKAVHAWTVNAEREITRMKHLQVDNIITDRPLLAREVLYREEGTEGILEFLKEALR